jgi:hypothetical protein
LLQRFNNKAFGFLVVLKNRYFWGKVHFETKFLFEQSLEQALNKVPFETKFIFGQSSFLNKVWNRL